MDVYFPSKKIQIKLLLALITMPNWQNSKQIPNLCITFLFIYFLTFVASSFIKKFFWFITTLWFYFIYLFIYFSCIGFPIHITMYQATGIHVFPLLNTPPSSPPHLSSFLYSKCHVWLNTPNRSNGITI